MKSPGEIVPLVGSICVHHLAEAIRDKYWNNFIFTPLEVGKRDRDSLIGQTNFLAEREHVISSCEFLFLKAIIACMLTLVKRVKTNMA